MTGQVHADSSSGNSTPSSTFLLVSSCSLFSNVRTSSSSIPIQGIPWQSCRPFPWNIISATTPCYFTVNVVVNYFHRPQWKLNPCNLFDSLLLKWQYCLLCENKACSASNRSPEYKATMLMSSVFIRYVDSKLHLSCPRGHGLLIYTHKQLQTGCSSFCTGHAIIYIRYCKMMHAKSKEAMKLEVHSYTWKISLDYYL